LRGVADVCGVVALRVVPRGLIEHVHPCRYLRLIRWPYVSTVT